MSRNFVLAFAIGLGIVAVLVTGVMLMQRGSAINIEAKFLKVRTAPLDENSTVAAIDLRVTNPSDLLLEVRQVTVEMIDASSISVNGEVISESDTKRVFDAV